MSLKAKNKAAISREIDRLEKANRTFKKLLPRAGAFGVVLSFLFPILPKRSASRDGLLQSMEYEQLVIFFLLLLLVLLFGSYFVITSRNKKKIDTYKKLKSNYDQ